MNLVSLCGHTFDADRLPERPRVLDVGARDCKFSLGILELRPGAKILAIEPDPNAASPVGIQIMRAALVGDRRKKATYVSFSTGEGNYIAEPWDCYRPDSSRASVVDCVDIRDITRAELIEKWDLVKLDCEGSEFGILENWPVGGIAGQISVEFHDYKNQRRWNNLYFPWLWTQLTDYRPVQHAYTKQGEAWGHWDSLLVRI